MAHATSETLIFDRKTREDREYWVQRLSGEFGVSSLTPDGPRPAAPWEKDSLEFALDRGLCQKLAKLTRGNSFLLYTTLSAALKVCLYKHGAGARVAVGSPARLRADGEPEPSNLLAIVDEFGPELTFREVLGRVRQSLTEAYEHQQYPFGRAVRDAGVAVEQGRCPVFDVVLALEGFHAEPPEMGQDIQIRWRQEGELLRAEVEHKRGLYRRETVQRFAGHYEQVLREGLEGAERRVRELNCCGEAERHQLLVEWNDTEVEAETAAGLPRIFERQAELTGDAIAVAFEDEQLSYGELNRRANRLARYLRRLGVGPEVRVGLFVERSAETVVALLGILKAGGAYVPLDTQYPQARLAFMIEDARLQVLLTRQTLVERLPRHGAGVVCLDGEWAAIAGESAENFPAHVTGEHVAYVTYTSGSTGRPKGVEVCHRGVLRLLLGVSYARLSASERLLHLSPLAFDASTFELWGALLHGGTVVLLPPGPPTPEVIGRAVAEHGVTAAWLTSSLFNAVMDSEPEALRPLEQLLVGGEALSARHVRRALELLPRTQLTNGYGPTEATTFTCTWGIPREFGESETIRIGRAIENTRVYVLDASGQAAPVGVAGELYVGGDGLARGYLNRAELTAERFVPHPLGDESGGRLYRTGDLVRYLSDGSIEYLGRLDRQVKIRGFRIETGETEAVIGTHPSVRETVVVVREDEPGQKRLVAYVVARQDVRNLSVGELRDFLKERLPEYMVPASFVLLEALPLNANGKVDRRALPEPDNTGPEDENYVAPRTPEEEILAVIFAQLLNVERVSVNDSFFDLGGHSLLATQLTTRVEEMFQVETPLKQVFETPTVGELAGFVRDARLAGHGLSAPPILPASRTARTPLSFAQQRLWFVSQLLPDKPLYLIPVALALDGPLNLPALEAALAEVARRHESLRTTFAAERGHAFQLVTDQRPTLSIVDLRGGDGAAASGDLIDDDLTDGGVTEGVTEGARAACRGLIAAESARPFDLARHLPLRATLALLSARERVLLLTFHHIATDGWSTALFIRELGSLYAAFATGAPSPLAELSLQYADFAVWQREWLRGEVLERQLDYWVGRLRGVSGVLELPADRARTTERTFKSGREAVAVPAEVAARLAGVARRRKATTFMTLLAGLQALLYRWTGQADICVGSPIANRNRAETEGLIGFFVNLLVLRAEVSGGETFGGLLERVREETLGAYAHQDVPFELVVEATGVERSLAHAPLVQVTLTYQSAGGGGGLELPGVGMRTLSSGEGVWEYDLSLLVSEAEGGGLVGTLIYNADVVERASARRLVWQWVRVLEGVSGDEGVRVGEVEVVSEWERHQLLVEWNDTPDFDAGAGSLAEIFEAQVAERGEAVAVVYEDAHLTYGELNRRANRLANYLRVGCGVGLETRVGVLLERSVEAVEALLGIVKAGGAYVPLDPAYPLERLSFMLEDAHIPVLVTRDGLLDHLPSFWGHVVCVDGDGERIARHDARNPAPLTGADNAAYVIYTSGSTGRPKGVVVTQRAITTLVRRANYVELTPDDRVAQASNASFDAATFEIWGALLGGARLVGVPRKVALEPEALGARLREQQISAYFVTTALFNQIAQRSPRALAGVRHVLFGGEAVDPRRVAEVLAQDGGGPERLLHVYGPTETTTYASWQTVREVAEGAATVPIGRAVSGRQLYVLDGLGQEAPIGVVGELCIGGDGLAREYLNRPAQTAERFVPHPYAGVPGARVYRTGDLARYAGEGALEFVGRADNQVKVRGFRIELGEIEAALRQHPEVEEVAVAALEDEEGGERRLVAYVATGARPGPTVSELQRYLKGRLPEYMVPGVFVMLEELPLNANGKVDRRALPAPSQERPNLEEAYVAPGTPTERALAQAWAEVLKLERVGVHDNFFDLGGDSIRSVQVLARAQESGVGCSVQQLFQHPTIHELARALDAAEPAVRQSEEVLPLSLITEADRARVPEWVEDAYPLTRMQAGMLFHSELSPQTAVYHDIISFHLHAPLDVPAMRATVAELVRRHPALRTTFDLTGFGEPLQLVHRQVELPLEIVDLRELTGAEVEAVLAADMEAEKLRDFRWEQEPLIRFRIHQRDAQTFQLMLSLHHAVLDGWSLSTLLTELFQHYWFLLGESAEDIAPPPQLSYRHFVALEQQALKSVECRRYWREQLDGCKPQRLPRWPAAQAGPRKTEDKVTDFSEETISGLQQLARTTGTSLKYVALAAHLRVLALLAGQQEAITGVVSHGRPEGRDSERVVGLFLNTVPFRVALPGGTWEELVAEAFRTEQEMLPYRSYPLVEIKQMLDGQVPFETSFGFVHFYVYQALEQFEEKMAVLGGQSVIETNFTLAVNFTLDPFTSKLELTLSSDGAELRAGQVDAIQGYYRRVLAEMAANPRGRYEHYSPLAEAERHQLLLEWNDTTAPVNVECVHRLFERQAARTPEAVAVVFDDAQMSYGELNRRANQLAHYLRASGVSTEMRVGVCMERSPEMIVGFLATLKAGGCVVPLDPAYPLERLAFILEDASIPVVLSQESAAEKLPAFWGQVVCVEEVWDEVAEYGETEPAGGAEPENAAYLVYTSGSTGTPRGVVVPHRGVGNMAASVDYFLDVRPESRVLQFASLSFDASVYEIFKTLLGGATLVLAARERLLPGPDLLRLLREQAVTVATLPPSVLAALPVAPLAELRTLVVAGEACTADLVARWGRGRRFVNAYGPSETTVCASVAVSLGATDEPHIGRPIANTRLHLFDAHLQPVPPGVAGELCIAGVGLSRGYLNRPELTADKFRPNPLGSVPGERLYRTGDLCQYRPDGNIAFLGRADHQVKIRGFRIEPGEVESVLAQHPAVREAVVLPREDAHGDKLLVAYVVPAQKALPATSERRLYRLPNRLEIAHLNKNETDVMYREIFQEQMYLRHGIKLRDGDCVFDVGANIGLFSLYVNHVCRDLKVYAFEPVPPIFDVLRTNAALYGLNVELCEAGIAERARTASVTFYPKMSGMSGLYADAAADEQLTRAFLKNQGGELQTYADELLEGRFASETYSCQVKTLSQVIRETRVESVDLLKIDVEKSELDVLSGVEPADWPKIRQVVMEVHDIDGQLGRVTSLLRGRGFHVVSEEGGGFESTGLYHVYAMRDAPAGPGSPNGQHVQPALMQLAPATTALSMSELRQHLRDRLPAYMVPAVFVQLDSLPLTPNGKIDRRALPAPEADAATAEKSYVPPGTPTEEMLAQIWESVLSVERVARHEDFFDLGGHSLLATQVISRVRQVFEVELPIQRLFDHPTLAELAACVEEARRGRDGLSAPPIVRVPRGGELPLSFAQQRLWFIDQLIPGNPAYNIPAAMRLSGRLNVAALEQTLGEVVRRHEMLRTAFVTSDGQPAQVIQPARRLRLARVDLGGLPADEREAAVQRLATADAWRPFDLGAAPLLRVKLLRLKPDEHVLLLTVHHIISDGWSAGVLFREIAALYQAFIEERPSPLEELPVQYADFAVWQRQWLQGEVLEAQAAFWREQLAGAPTLLELPTDRPRPTVQTFNGKYRSLLLPAPLSEALRALSRREGVSLFMTMLSAFQTLLYRYSGQDDISVGTPIANRNRAETEGLIGFFVNTLVLRSRLSGGGGFVELLRQVRAATLSAYTHQDMPFEQLVDVLRPERALSHTPLFQVMFIMQNAPQDSWELPGLTLAPLKTGSHTVRFDLTLTVTEAGEWIGGTLEYNTDLFESARVERMVSQFQTLLRGIVSDPERSLATLPLLTEPEQHQLLKEWNGPAEEVLPEALTGACLHHSFERRAQERPDRLAVVRGDEQMTYGELNRRANQLAHHLRALGVGPEVRVGLLLERSPRLVVALLAVLKSGGAYVPLDPAYPAERLSFILEDAAAHVLLTERSLLARVPETAPRALCLDDTWMSHDGGLTSLDDGSPDDVRERETTPAGAARPGNMAYLIYTSGSTGRPKAVVIEHRSAAAFLRWAAGRFAAQDLACVLASTSVCFDLSVFELFGPLAQGGAVALAEDALRLPGLPCAGQVTLINTVPSAMTELLRMDALPSSVRVVNLAGEPLRRSLVRQVYERGTVREVFNLYGPSEDTTYSTCAAVGASEEGSPAIGRPLSGRQAYVLDAHMGLVAAGQPGELYLGGEGLARGYFGRPELTAERFVPDPFGTCAGGRLYRTGDVARRRGDGQLEYLGRGDHQVKIRGFRIEMGEVEAALERHEGIAQAVVVAREDAREDGREDKRLVAYVVAKGGRAPGVEELRAHLRARLPEHMVPSAFVTLESLPLTPNGKVDRLKLPAPGSERPELIRAFEPPQTPAEEVLARIWSSLLGFDRVGRHDNFFDLGGDSILSIQIVARANQAGLKLTPQHLFRHQTIAELAAAAADIAPSAPKAAGHETGQVPLTPTQRRFFEQDAPDPRRRSEAARFELLRPLTPTLLTRAVERLTARHDALRLRFVREGDGWRQLRQERVEVPPVGLVDLSTLAGREQERALESLAEQLRAGLNLSQAPLFGAALVELGEGRPRQLLVVVHQLIADGASLRVLVRDLQTACDQLSRGRAVEFGPQASSFGEWAERLAAPDASESAARELDYWLELSRADAPPPPFEPGGDDGANDAAPRTVEIALSPDESRSLLRDIPVGNKVSVDEVLLTALAETLTNWTGGRSLLVELEASARQAAAVGANPAGAVGQFISSFPVCLNLAGAGTANERLRTVKEQLRRVPGVGVGYGVLRYQRAGGAAEQLRALPAAGVRYRCLEPSEEAWPESGLFRPVKGPGGATRGAASPGLHALEICPRVQGNQLRVVWACGGGTGRAGELEELAESYLLTLRTHIARCLSEEAGAFIPSDFPTAGLSQQELDELLTEIED